MSKPNVWPNTPVFRLGLALALSLILLIGLLLSIGLARLPDVALAQGSTVRYVATTGNNGGNDCTTSSTPCATIQHAVDVADPGDEIRVATGVYTGVQARPRNDLITTGVVTQVVYISKTVTVRGGYTTTNWVTSDLIANPTTLDAQQQGRGLYITGNISPTIEGLRITGGHNWGLGGDPSSDLDAGGGIYVFAAKATINHNQIFDNIARTMGVGGGLAFLNSTDVTLNGNTIISNTGCALAGGVYFRNSSGAVLIANAVSNNEAGCPGGGMKHNGGIHVLLSDDTTLINNTVSGNGADNTCGGIGIRASGNSLLVGNNIVSNTAGSPGFFSAGGGLCLEESGPTTLIGNTIIGNMTFGGGGGLIQTRGSSSWINNVIADNHAWGVGSGLLIQGASPPLLHNTIARNSGGDGSGLHITDIFGRFSTVAMTNTILASHTVGISVGTGNTAILNGVLWDSNTTNSGGDGTIIVTNEYSGDPAFAADGYHLTAGSAAIDRGVNAGVDDDIDGDPRPIGLGYDLGADEFSAALEVTKQVEPDPVQAGEQLTYTIRLTNTGDLDLHATITDTFPPQVTPNEPLTWTPTITAPGGVWIEQFTVTAQMGYSGTLTNVVQVTTDEGVMAVYTETSQVWVTPRLEITKQADPNPVQPGEPLTYTIRLTNTGNVTLTATITDFLPNHVTPTGTLIWTPDPIAPGGAWTEQVTVTVETDYIGLLTNAVQVTTQEGANGTAEATVCVGSCLYLPVVTKN